jgi:CubicO group peptidase (beta-lactamase class C family)
MYAVARLLGGGRRLGGIGVCVMTDDFEEDFRAPEPATRRALAHRLAVAQAEGRAPSVVAAVVREGRVVWCAARGELPPGSPADRVQYRIGSITKTLTAVAVMRLRDEGLIDLGDPLGVHLPTPHGGEATIAQLLSHSGGLAAEARGPWWERTPGDLRPELADIFGEPPYETPLKHPAGRRHHYSNPGYALLGALVERLRGAPWFEVLRQEVLEPLGMRRTTFAPLAPHATGWAVHPHADVRQPEPAVDTGRMAPAGQLWSTAADLSAFAAFLLAGDEGVLGAASLAEMRAPAVAPEARDWDAAYGLGMQLWRRDGRMLSGHSGSMPGFLAAVYASPAERLAAVALANATSGPLMGTLATDLLAEVAAREPAMPGPWRPMPGADADPELVALTGVWYWGTNASELRLHAGRELTLGPVGGAGAVRGSRFVPRAEADGGGWLGREGYYAGEVLRVVRRADGSVSHLDLGTFVFTRTPYDPDPGTGVPGGADRAGWVGGDGGGGGGGGGVTP